MSRESTIFYTQIQPAWMRERWRAGDSLEQLSRVFDRRHSSVRRILRETGGIRPAERRRGAKALTIAEREEISCAKLAWQSMLRGNWGGRPRPSAERSSATVELSCIG